MPIRLTASRCLAIGLLLAAIGVGLMSSLRLALAAEPAANPVLAEAATTPGRILFVHAGDIWSMANGRVDAVTHDGGWEQPEASPDGSRIVAVGMYASASELFLLDPDGSNERQLTRNRRTPAGDSNWAFRPKWAPDGSSIAFVTDRSSFYPMLWRMNPDGSGLRQIVFPNNGLDAIDSFNWSPDGRFIAATRFLSARSQVYVIDPARPAGARALTSGDGAFDPSWSPDGTFVTYIAREGNRNVIYAVDAQSGGRPVQLADAELARSPVWSPLGNSIAYVGLVGGVFEIFSFNVTVSGSEITASSRPVALTSRLGVDPISGLSWSQ